MIKKTILVLKVGGLFMTFWLLNNGFLIEPIWQPIQAAFFTLITVVIFKYIKVKLIYWFYLVGVFYVASAIFDFFKILIIPDIMASTGFGILVIVIVVRFLKRSS